ncbi:MAG: aspartate--tRNA(Asn) ligase [Clostridia bacterium]|nr:aspartate--tRNA(Asn) ligase [Clostridia bacterium]
MEYISLEKKVDNYDIEVIIEKYKNGEIKNNDTVKVKGYIHRIRKMSGFAFVILRTSRRLIQSVFTDGESKGSLDNYEEEDTVILTGTIVNDERSKMGFELRVIEIEKLSGPIETLPIVINKKQVDCNIDVLLDNRIITMRNPYERAIFKLVDGILFAFRDFLRKEGFTEFIPPKIVQAGAEGGADMFQIEYFDKLAYLNQSPQMYKQIMVGVFNKVFTTSPVFRAEKHGTRRHINEFEGLDLEMGFIDSFEDIMVLEARMMKYLVDVLNKDYALELEEINLKLPEVKDIPMIKFAEVKDLIAKEYNRPYRDKFDLEPEEEKLIGKYFNEKYNSQFVFVTHYPEKKRPFYAKEDPKDSNYTLSFDLLLNGAEITTGGQRINDYNEQVAKMQRRGMDITQFEDYLTMHKYGMPPHGGLGIGLERLSMKLLQLENIRMTTAFPRDMERLRP